MSNVHVCPARAKPVDSTERARPSLRPQVVPIHIDAVTGTTSDETATLLQTVLGCSRPAVQRIVRRMGGLSVMSRFSPQGLMQRTGLPLHQARRLHAALQLGHRKILEDMVAPTPLETAESVAQWLRPYIAGLPHEELWMLALDSQCALVGACRVSQGFSSSTSLVIPVVLQRALEMGAAGMIVAHNHPGGSLDPSEEDISMTVHLYNAARVIRLVLVDHVILGRRGHLSMRGNGLMPESAIPAIEAMCPEEEYSGPPDWITLAECTP